jgi:triosephosphate isomerase
MTVVRTPLVVGNWKMNGAFETNRMLIETLLAALAQAPLPEISVCPPFPYLPQIAALLAETPMSWGAQTVSEHRAGAYTGQVSAPMLRNLGCRFVIVGHSERRQYCGETDEQVAAQAMAALDSGLMPIICVGESAGLANEGASVVIAYEPVWAIGTGKTPTPEGVQAVHAHIRRRLLADGLVQTRILYGGSVKGSNAASLFALPDVDGGLIGGAALDAQDFSTICIAAQKRAL